MNLVSFSAPVVSGHTSRRARGALLPRQGLHFLEGDPSSSWGRSLEKAEARSPQGAATAPKRCPRQKGQNTRDRINVASRCDGCSPGCLTETSADLRAGGCRFDQAGDSGPRGETATERRRQGNTNWKAA